MAGAPGGPPEAPAPARGAVSRGASSLGPVGGGGSERRELLFLVPLLPAVAGRRRRRTGRRRAGRLRFAGRVTGRPPPRPPPRVDTAPEALPPVGPSPLMGFPSAGRRGAAGRRPPGPEGGDAVAGFPGVPPWGRTAMRLCVQGSAGVGWAGVLSATARGQHTRPPPRPRTQLPPQGHRGPSPAQGGPPSAPVPTLLSVGLSALQLGTCLPGRRRLHPRKRPARSPSSICPAERTSEAPGGGGGGGCWAPEDRGSWTPSAGGSAGQRRD